MISLQLLKCEYLLVSLVFLDSLLNVFAFWTDGQTKYNKLELSEIIKGIFFFFLRMF